MCWWLAIVAVKTLMLGVHTASAPFFVFMKCPSLPGWRIWSRFSTVFKSFFIDKPRKRCYFASEVENVLHRVMDMRMQFRRKTRKFFKYFSLSPPVGDFKAVWSAFYEKTYKFLFFSTGRSGKRQKFRFSVKIKIRSRKGTEKEKRQPTGIDYLCEYGIVISMSVAIESVWRSMTVFL